MKIAIIGAGAIGGYVGAKLALAGEEVTFIVRGANLAAIAARGIKLIDNDGTEHDAPDVKATDDYASAGVQELVILALKAHQVDAVADQIGHLMGPDTVVVTMQNGIPFWYFHQHGGQFEGHVVKCFEPTGTLARKIAPINILGCVVYPAAVLIAQGVIQHL
jgi:2-dehydropantoate 2-reductase